MKRNTIPASRIARRSAGVGLVTAIFLLVVLAGLGAAMVTIFSTQRAVSTLDEQGARAYQAARAGIEWGVFRRLRLDTCDGPHSFALPAGSSLSGFAVTVRCTRVTAPAAVSTITAVACNMPAAGNACPNPSNSPDYVEREIEVQL